jgi:type IV secretory pathway protease TraF
LVLKCAVALGGDRVPATEPSPIARRDTVRPGAVFLLGDNAAAGGDSRVFGAVPVGALVGVLVGRLPSLG